MKLLYFLFIMPITSFILSNKPIILFDVNVLNNIQSDEIWNDAKSISFENTSIFCYSPSVIKKINEWNHVSEIIMLSPYTSVAREIGLDVDNFQYIEESANLSKAHIGNNIINALKEDRPVFWIDQDLELWDDYEIMRNQYKRKNIAFICPRYCLSNTHIKLIDECLIYPELWKGKTIKEFKTWSWTDKVTYF